MRSPPLQACLLAALVLGLGGCVGPFRNCTDMGATSTLTLRFEPPPSEPGRWAIELNGDSAEWDVPLGDLPPWEHPLLPVLQDDELVGVRYHLHPAQVGIELYHDDTLVLSEVLEAAYDRSEPNGRGCGVTLTATETLEP